MAGLLEWSNAIRFTMANDPGREIFKDQLNTHGFIFLDDYLENILSGPSQDPIIELVKTPGRKKVTCKKPKGLGPLGLTTIAPLKENQEPKQIIKPLNSLHEALLQARGLPTLGGTNRPLSQHSATGDSLITPSETSLDNQTLQTTSDRPTSQFLAPGRLNQNDLSVIAEDDENLELKTHSRRNSDVPPPPTWHTLPELQRPGDSQKRADSGQSVTMTESSSDIIFHSIALDSPSPSARNPAVPPFSPILPEVNPTKPIDISESGRPSPNVSLNAVPKESMKELLSLRAPDSNPGSRDLELPFQDSSQVPSSGDKIGVTLFPTLPAPMPLRKSVRTSRDPPVGVDHTTTPAPPGGKRTSWLKKAREIKALEATIKHTNTTLPAIPGPSSENVLKRKSADLLASSDTITLRDQERNSKSVKSNETDEAPLKATMESSQSHQKMSLRIDEVLGQEGMLDRFKRTVEDLGARVGKTISKSLGAGAATSALAEARAAAEARVVERLQKEEEMTRVSGSTESTTTTPPDSPPTSHRNSSVLHPGTIFDKPPPVFIPPVSTSNTLLHEHGMSLPSVHAFSLPVSMSLGLGTHLQLPSSPKHPISTMESIRSDDIFDNTNSSAWMPETQDTDYSSRYGSQPQNCQTPIDGDDSWPVDEKLATGAQWTFGHTVKEDSMTWSTLPSQSQRGDTGKVHSYQDDRSQGNELGQTNTLPIPSGDDIDGDLDEDVTHGDSDLDDVILHGQSTVSFVEKAPKSGSQVSMVSSQSSQSHTRFPGQTSRLLSSTLGSSKKGNSDVKKVLQMAAAAAKKQQEESDKKAARLKEMENRRQLAVQRKAEEERTRTLEQERKVKEEGERRKREREENTDKRPTKVAVKKDEDNGKKRKVASSDSEKREGKKLPPKVIPKSSSLKPPSALSSSTVYNVSYQTTASSSTLNDSRLSKPPVITAGTGQKGKGKVPTTPSASAQDDLSQPSQLVQIQMAARAKAQIQTAHLTSEPPVTSESIELPEINSEYSDSDDEDRSKAFPGWAQSPELRQALQLQSTINPDDIFGAIRPLRMEEMFKARNSRFRARTSSANWTGTDRLTMEEERDYAKRMGFK
ncbi:Inner centromere protein-related protein pic1 [Termitomyces sp. J132]|nr:Inner centromere protein-related protein pic1 [Termitomyces sp. J132]